MAPKSISTLLKQEWELIVHAVDTLLPKNPSFRFLTFLGLLVGALALLSSFGSSDRNGPNEPVLTQVELDVAKTYARREHVTLEAAKAAIVAARPSPEEQRRFEYERKQREQAVEAIQADLCQTQPWLDRCQ